MIFTRFIFKRVVIKYNLATNKDHDSIFINLPFMFCKIFMLFFTKNANSTEELFAMWTNSKSMVYSMKLLFESLWTSSKNIHL